MGNDDYTANLTHASKRPPNRFCRADVYRRKMRAMLLTAIATACLLAPQAAAPQAPDAAVADVRQTLDTARKEVDVYNAYSRAGSPDHPAIKWDAALWAYREKYPRSEASAMATAGAVRLLVRSELWGRAHARVASVDFDDPAWERLPSVIYDEAIARKDLPYAIGTLTRAAESTKVPANKAVALLVTGRAYRRQGDSQAATRTLEAAKAAAPGSPYAEEADGVIYEIAHLSLGMAPPPIVATARDGRTVSLAALRGKPVVLVFWGTT